jgi:hypothetical protein
VLKANTKANFVKVSMCNICDPIRKNYNIHYNKASIQIREKDEINTIMKVYLSEDIVDVFLRYI